MFILYSCSCACSSLLLLLKLVISRTHGYSELVSEFLQVNRRHGIYSIEFIAYFVGYIHMLCRPQLVGSMPPSVSLAQFSFTYLCSNNPCHRFISNICFPTYIFSLTTQNHVRSRYVSWLVTRVRPTSKVGPGVNDGSPTVSSPRAPVDPIFSMRQLTKSLCRSAKHDILLGSHWAHVISYRYPLTSTVRVRVMSLIFRNIAQGPDLLVGIKQVSQGIIMVGLLLLCI